MRPAHHCNSDCQLGVTRVTCYFFHRLRDLLARTFAFQRKAGQLLQHLHGATDGLNQLTPVNLANQAQAVDDIADG